MSELRKLQTTDWERRNLGETADAMAHIFPETERVIQDLLSDYDVLRADRDRLTAENERLRRLLERLRAWDHMGGAGDGPYWVGEIDAALAATAPGEEQGR